MALKVLCHGGGLQSPRMDPQPTDSTCSLSLKTAEASSKFKSSHIKEEVTERLSREEQPSVHKHTAIH